MKFVIEAMGLTAGGGKAGLLRLLPSLARHADHRFVALLPDLPEFVALQRSLQRPNLKLILRRKPASLLRRHFDLQGTVRRICSAERADALLCLGNFGPRRPPVPTVVLLHNAHYVSISPCAAAASTTLRERLVTAYGRDYLRRLPDGVRLVVQTELMKQRAVAAYGLEPSRIEVIPDGDALPPEAEISKRQDGGAAGVHALFTFLCLSRYYPHKNLEVLPEAMKRLPAYSSRPARCLLTIHRDQHPGARRLLGKIESLGPVLVNLGPVATGKLAEVYRSADAFILPTLLESFGRTYLEAMRFDLPILTSDRDFARHLCREAALYFDPLDPESVARSMARSMEEGDLRTRLIAGRETVLGQVPSWEEIGDRFVDVLERAARDSHLPSRADDSHVRLRNGLTTSNPCDIVSRVI
ncbi:MAG TPA: glycosyltransferase [Terriglobia bacterium]